MSLADDIREIYKQAASDIRETLKVFLGKKAAKAARLLEQVKTGKITLQDYQAWLRGQVFMGKRWERLLDNMVKSYVNADTLARDHIGSAAKKAFTGAANHAAYDIEKDTGGAVSFDLYDSKAVERLLEEDPQVLPEWKIDEPKDYIWNQKRVQNAVTQAILQGDGVPELMRRLVDELATSNEKKMRLFARTALTGAHNAATIERMREASAMGIHVKKKWLATRDERTRNAHRDLDGQVREVDEPFKVDDKEIKYPGDPTAKPELVYNCRCTLTYVYDFQHAKRHTETGVGDEFMNYREWEKAKKG